MATHAVIEHASDKESGGFSHEAGPAAMGRRGLLAAGLSAAAGFALAGCQSLPAFTLEEAVRRLLYRASERSLARLTTPGGYWDETILALGLPTLLGVNGELVSGILTSPPLKARLERAFAGFALEASDRAAPVVTDAVRVIGIRNARAIVDGGPNAATDYLRSAMGSRLLDAMVPELGQALRLANDPVIGQALGALAGVDAGKIAARLGGQIEALLWQEMGRAEAAIRADPGSTGDATLIAIFGLSR